MGRSVDKWVKENNFSCEEFSEIGNLVRIKNEKGIKISLCIPTLNEEKTVGKIIRFIKKTCVKEHKLLDEIAVIDSGSKDKTKEVAIKAGAEFYPAKNFLKELGPCKGKGENLWKALYLLKGDIIVWVDGDIENIHPRFVYGLVGPLLLYNHIKYVKPYYKRPIKMGEIIYPSGGGRVTEILVRPLFNMFFPRLTGFFQPLSGEGAGRREILERIPYFTGYGVETAMLIDIKRKFGLKSIAQVDLIERVHRNQPLESLSRMAYGILQVFVERANALGKIITPKAIKQTYSFIDSTLGGPFELMHKKIIEVQRPPMIKVRAYREKFYKKV